MRSQWSWPGKVVVVTGASRGIGAATARLLSERGAYVGLVSRSEADLKAVADTLVSPSVVAPGDVTDEAAVDRAIGVVREERGPIDVLVNNAGIGSYRSFETTSAEQALELWQANVAGVIHATQAVMDDMRRRGDGVIVNIASVAGRIGAPFESAYSASKFAVVGMTESLRTELHGSGVHVALVNPGPVATDFFTNRGVPYARRFPRPVAAEEVALAVMEVAERRRDERYVPRWLSAAVMLKTLFPPLYRAGSAFDARQLST